MRKEFATLGENELRVRESDENFDCYRDKKGVLIRTRKKTKAEIASQHAEMKAEEEDLRKRMFGRR